MLSNATKVNDLRWRIAHFTVQLMRLLELTAEIRKKVDPYYATENVAQGHYIQPL